jgi:hypothetical protein
MQSLALEREPQKCEAVFRRNQIPADCVNLFAYPAPPYESITFRDLGPATASLMNQRRIDLAAVDLSIFFGIMLTRGFRRETSKERPG